MKVNVRIAGSGGQGAVFAGIILARAAVLYDAKHATQKDGKFAIQTQSYGPEARGSVSKSDVKISDEKICYPYVEIPNILIVMSEQAYTKYSKEIGDTTIVLIDEDLVKSRPKVKYYKIPTNKIAKEIGKQVVTNIVMIGALCGITQIISKEAVEKAIIELAPKGSETFNRTAFDKGYKFGEKLKSETPAL
ncbi:MAG: 2-oxoacid:acceptor oxidoreductase family protein [bacterium]